MKKVRYVSAAVVGSIVGFIALGGVASADPSDDSSSTQLTSPEDSPTTQYDRDGVPLSVTQKQPQKATPEEIAAYRKAQAKAAADKDWLLRAYEKQLQTHDAANSSAATQFQAANPYEEISANKDLAKLAGLPDLEDDNVDEKPLPRTGNDEADHSSASLHPGSSVLSTSAPAAQPFGSSFLKPMITPLSAPDAAGLNNFYSSLPVAGLTPYYATDQPNAAPALPGRVSVVPEDVDHDIDTPGMVAAEKNPLADPNASDLTLDVLPGESLEHAKAHQDNNDTLLQLPQAMDADQFHRAQAAELAPPVPKTELAKQNQDAAAAVAPTKPADDYDAPVPISKYPIITPVHAPIANPYDILNR